MSAPRRTDGKTPTKAQRELLNFAEFHGGVKRVPGGFWLEPSFTGDPRWSTHFSTTTVQACLKRGWLCNREGSEPEEWKRVHKITPAGLAALTEDTTP